MKDKEGLIIWNLGLKRAGNARLELVMPDIYGELQDQEGLDQVISWPVNPNFTGREAIVYMLNTNYCQGFLESTII